MQTVLVSGPSQLHSTSYEEHGQMSCQVYKVLMPPAYTEHGSQWVVPLESLPNDLRAAATVLATTDPKT